MPGFATKKAIARVAIVLDIPVTPVCGDDAAVHVLVDQARREAEQAAKLLVPDKSDLVSLKVESITALFG